MILGASFAGLPLAGSQVVASSVVGAGGGRRRWGRVSWVVVREMGIAWLTTIPATALLAAAALGVLEVAVVKLQRWFLPETPDVIGMLGNQLEMTTEGVDALAEWARGDSRRPTRSAISSTAATSASASSRSR